MTTKEANLQGKVVVELGSLLFETVFSLELDFLFLNLIVFAVRLNLLNCITIYHIQNEFIKIVIRRSSIKLLNVKEKGCSVFRHLSIAGSSW